MLFKKLCQSVCVLCTVTVFLLRIESSTGAAFGKKEAPGLRIESRHLEKGRPRPTKLPVAKNSTVKTRIKKKGYSKQEMALRQQRQSMQGILRLNMMNESKQGSNHSKTLIRTGHKLLSNYIDFNLIQFLLKPIGVFSTVDFIFYVHSSAKNRRRRYMIRNTWGKTQEINNKRLRTIFVLGYSEKQNIQKAVYLEHETFGDILLLNVVESYYTLNYKAIGFYKWFTDRRLSADYIVKSDDDIIINPWTLTRYFSSRKKYREDEENTILCHMWYYMVRQKNQGDKWYIGEDKWPHPTYPPYCSGSAYAMTSGVPRAMLTALKTTKQIWIDDVFVTGILATAANITQKSIYQGYDLDGKINNATIRERFLPWVLFEVNVPPSFYHKYWKLMTNYHMSYKP